MVKNCSKHGNTVVKTENKLDKRIALVIIMICLTMNVRILNMS